MHICVLTNRPVDENEAARVIVRALRRAGNEVSEVRVVPESQPMPDDAVGVPSRVPRGKGRWRKRLRRAQPESLRSWDLERRITSAATATGADLFMPVQSNLLDAAVRAARRRGGAVMRTPAQSNAGEVDLIQLAPYRPDLALPPAGKGPFHLPTDTRSGYTPSPGRHAGKRVLLAYRKTDTNPGKYLEEALRVSGAEVQLETDRVDFASLHPDTDFVLFVEGPYPAMEVTGPAPDIPVLYWFHHGEHHLHANLRLADRYRADAVLMAHSWHLAHWVHAPVHRFPFGVPTELLDPSRPLRERRYDVAMVGAKLWEGGPYSRRQEIVAELEARFPSERLGFAENVTATEMARLYEDARMIVNEGGTRHYPITMRVFEAVGAGAVLVTDDLPGTDLLFERDRDYVVLEDDVASQVESLLADPDQMQVIADSAVRRALDRHTYHHRVDELFEIAATTQKRSIPSHPELSPLAALIDADPEVQRVAQAGAPELAEELGSRQVFEASALEPIQLQPGRMETVAVRTDDVSEFGELLLAARRYLYFDGSASGLEEWLEKHHPQAVVTRTGPITRVDLMAESYRVLPHEVIDG